MAISSATQPDVSVIVPTYNRCEILRVALDSLMNQERAGLNYEVIVVDNNSKDETRNTIGEVIRSFNCDNLVYCFEAKQGVSYARNTGIATARAPILAFADDDIRPASDWVASIHEAFKSFPEVDCIGGKVLPDPGTEFPAWLTTHHWTPLALLDFGDKPIKLDVQNGPGLISANLAVRASVFEEVGSFQPQLQRVKDGIGSMEDYEFEMRLATAKKQIMYLPQLVVYAHVFEERLTKAYHRRWYCGHGRFYARMRHEVFESSKARVLDVPGHLYRRTWSHMLNWLKYRLTNTGDLEFQQELQIQFFWGFFRERFADRRNVLEMTPR
jgi:glycosyltransferase involved in cell wall biosynthesis